MWVFLVDPKVFLLFLGQQAKGLGQFVNFVKGRGPIIYIVGQISNFLELSHSLGLSQVMTLTLFLFLFFLNLVCN